MTTSRVYGTSGSRRLTTDSTTVVLAGIQGPAGADAVDFTWRGAWNATTIYAEDDAVFYGQDSWISVQGGNVGQPPSDGSAYWDRMTDSRGGSRVENGFEDRWDAEYGAREWTDISFIPENYVGAGVWLQARLTVVLNTPGPDPDPVSVWSEGTELLVGSNDTIIKRSVDLPAFAPSGLYVFWYDGDGEIQYDTMDSVNFTELIERYALIAIVSYIGATETIPDILWTNGDAVIIADERHGRTMDSRTHSYLHITRGAAYVEGMSPTDVLTDGNGDTAEQGQIGVAAGSFWDEDIRHELAALAKPATIPMIWREGASGDWVVNRVRANNYIWYRHTNGTSGRPSWNEFTGATWQRTEVDNVDFMCMHLFAFNGRPHDGSFGYARPSYYLIMGQAEYNTLGNARTGAESEIASLDLGQLENVSPEFVPIATFIIQGGNAYGTGARIRTTDDGDDWIDWRRQETAVGGAGIDHNALDGRTVADTHPASSITNTPAGTVAATDVQAAINELDTEKVPTTRQVSTTLPLTGGGALASDKTLDINDATLAGTVSGGAKGAVPASGVTGDAGETLQLLSHNNRDSGLWLPMAILDESVANRRNSSIWFEILSNDLAVRDRDFFLRNTLGLDLFWQREEFIHGATFAGENGWIPYAGSGNFTLTFPAGEQNHPGIVRLNQATETNPNLIQVIYPNSLGYTLHNQDLDLCEAIVRIVADGGGNWPDIRFIVTTSVVSSRANNTIGFELLNTDANWHTISVDNSGTVTRQDTGVAGANGTWYRLRFGYNGSWIFAVNDSAVTAPAGSPNAVSAVPCIQIESKASADGGVDCDMIQWEGEVTR